MFKRVAVTAFFALVALCLPAGASAAGSALVFSEVTRHLPSGSGGEPRPGPATGGLFAFKNGHVRQLTTDPGDGQPFSSPDGSMLVFVRRGDIWAMPAGGSGLRQLTAGAAIDSNPQVAPNGRYVLFERRLPGHRPHDLYTSDLQGDAIRALAATAGEEREAAFSPDGRQIVYAHKDQGDKNDIWSIRPTGGSPRRLTQTPGANDFAPHFLGRTIVFSRGAKRQVPGASAAIYSMDRRGGHVVKVIPRGRWIRLEDVSTSTHTILFSRAGGLWVKPINGQPRRIVDFPKRESTTGVFSPDGRRIAAINWETWGESLLTLNAASGRPMQTVRVASNLEGSEHPSSLGRFVTWQPVPQRR